MSKSVNEVVIFEKILKFDEFRLFSQNEWKPRKEQGASIDWIIDSAIEQYAIQDCDPTTGRPFVMLRHLPETLDDAFLVAHEIVHVILDFDNESLQIKMNNAIARKKYRGDAIPDMARRLGSMLDDPRVDSFLLHEYNFSPSHFYAKVKLPDAIKGLTPSSEGQSDLIRWNQAMFYLQTKLQCDLVKDDEVVHKWGELENLYQKNRPNVKRIGEELYSMAKESGYDTLEKQKILFQRIINKYTVDGYKLNDILGIA